MKLFLTGILAATVLSDSRADAQSPKLDELISKGIRTCVRRAVLERASVRVTTLYKLDEDLGIKVPTRKEDRYPDRSGGEFRGKASYGRFRRFEVRTEETIHR